MRLPLSRSPWCALASSPTSSSAFSNKPAGSRLYFLKYGEPFSIWKQETRELRKMGNPLHSQSVSWKRIVLEWGEMSEFLALISDVVMMGLVFEGGCSYGEPMVSGRTWVGEYSVGHEPLNWKRLGYNWENVKKGEGKMGKEGRKEKKKAFRWTTGTWNLGGGSKSNACCVLRSETQQREWNVTRSKVNHQNHASKYIQLGKVRITSEAYLAF